MTKRVSVLAVQELFQANILSLNYFIIAIQSAYFQTEKRIERGKSEYMLD